MHDTIISVMTKDLVTCPPTASVRDAAKKMHEHNIGDVLVVDGEKLVGIVTDRDLVVRTLAVDLGAETPIAEVMSTDVCTVNESCTTGDAARLMADKAIRRVPVVDGERPIGIVSLGDLAETKAPETVLGEISDARPNN
ncbi:MAG: CBS domain-containing protein [Acidimicrobiia bacterium]|nr:CBS domain-containing protein [Acidimicrobiia bacterium]